MNREILFKAKVKNWKQLPKEEWWVEGYYGIKGNGTELEEHFIICSTFSPILSTYPFYFTDIQIDPETLCQYTGLKDKKGKKIWENDIVQAWSEGSNAIGKVIRRVDGLYIMYPAYQKKEFWGLYPNKNGKTTVEVIGNIFDNEELLEVE